MFVEMGRVSTQLAVMEWHSVLMAAMNSDVNDNHLDIDQAVYLPNFSAPPTTTLDMNASALVDNVMENPTVMMEATNEIVEV
jgi:hypothetical protein